MELHTLTGMVKEPVHGRGRIVPKSPARLYIAEHMAIRGMMPKDLAAELDVTEATISRWINNQRGINQHKQRAIEEVLKLPPGGLARPPSEAPAVAFLTGLDESQRKQAIKYIAFLRGERSRK